jgi:hypothetical protein
MLYRVAYYFPFILLKMSPIFQSFLFYQRLSVGTSLIIIIIIIIIIITATTSIKTTTITSGGTR